MAGPGVRRAVAEPATTDYARLLARARSTLPARSASHERFNVPEADVVLEGKNSIVRNFGDIIDTIRRDPVSLTAFLLGELGTAGTVEGRRMHLKGRVSPKVFDDKIKVFVEQMVLCAECGKPDTKLMKEGRTAILRCEACGAHRPVKAYKIPKAPEAPLLEEQKTYTMVVEEISKRGDGVARKERFTIYIPGGQKGSQYKILIEKISGTVAFGRIVP